MKNTKSLFTPNKGDEISSIESSKISKGNWSPHFYGYTKNIQGHWKAKLKMFCFKVIFILFEW